MSKFRIMPHGRLQEWVAEEKGYFRDEGLEYEFVRPQGMGRGDFARAGGTVRSSDDGPAQVMTGAFESMESGRACEVSSACHWAVNMASSASHGLMWGLPEARAGLECFLGPGGGPYYALVASTRTRRGGRIAPSTDG